MQFKRILRCFSAFLVCLMLFGTILPLSASADSTALDDAGAVYFINLESGEVVYRKNEGDLRYAASTGKIVAGLILCEGLGVRLTDEIYITPEMVASSAGHRLGISAGEIYTVEDLLIAAICGSYNDAFDTLACYLMGTKENFVSAMNVRAAELGTTVTRFSDVSGVDDLSQTSATDLAKIAAAAYQNPLYMEIADIKRHTIQGVKSFENRNKMIFQNAKCHGMNAGETARGGKCVVTVAKYGDEAFLCIVLGVPSDRDQYAVADAMVKWVAKNYAEMTVISPDSVIGTIPVRYSNLTSELSLCVKDSLVCYLPAGLEIGKDITYSIRLDESTVKAPVAPDTPVGYVAVIYQGRTLGTLPLYTASGAEYSFFVATMDTLKDVMSGRVFLSGAIFFAVALTAWIVTEYVIVRRKRHKWDKYFSEKMNPKPNVSFNKKPRRR